LIKNLTVKSLVNALTSRAPTYENNIIFFVTGDVLLRRRFVTGNTVVLTQFLFDIYKMTKSVLFLPKKIFITILHTHGNIEVTGIKIYKGYPFC
jgi:hypothetical protein